MSHKKAAQTLQRLLTIMARLRGPGGCPWDAEQTPETLKPFLLEECYETLEAIDSDRPEHVCEELGDLLLQIVFQSSIYEERGAFDMSDVISGIADKLERRHPHVFGDRECLTPAAVSRQWEAIKKQEKDPQQPPSALGSLTSGLPALMQAKKLTERASRAGFSSLEVNDALQKVKAEIAELEKALSRTGGQTIENKLGDLLFTTANLGRLLNLDAEEALRKTIYRFVARFTQVEKALEECGRSLQDASLPELESLWEKTCP